MEDIIVVLIAAAILIGIFLILREFWCWYWKINHRLNKLESIERELVELNSPMRRQQGIAPYHNGFDDLGKTDAINVRDESAGRNNNYHDSQE